MVSTTQRSGRARFGSDAGSVAAARRFARRWLVEWGADDLLEDALVLVSELATNAVVHAGTPFEVVCTDLGDGVRLEVCDQYPARGLPATPPAMVDPSRPSGRGLLLCATLSSSWGVEYNRTAKTVWCRLDLAGRSAPVSWPTEDLPDEPMLVAVVGTDAEGAVWTWSPDAEALLGWTAAAVRGTPLAELTVDGTLPAGPDPQPGGGPRRWQGELVMQHAYGDPVPVYAGRHPGRGRAGQRRVTWLLVPVAHRAALAPPRPTGTAGGAGDADTAWAAFSDADLVRLRFEDLLQRVADRACDAFEGDAAYLLLAGVDGGDPRLAVTGLLERGPEQVAAPPPVPAPLGAGGLPAVHDDLPETGAIPLLVGTRLRSAVVAPLLAEGRQIGQLCVASARPGQFGKDDAAALQRAADRLALSVEVRRVAELTRRHRDQFGFLAEASDLLAGTLDPQMTLAMLAQLLVPRLAVWCALWVQDDRGAATFSYVWHADEDQLDVVRSALDALLAAAHPARRGGDPGSAEPFRVAVPELGADPAIGMPLRARGRTLGAAVLGRRDGDWLGRDDLDLAAELSRRAALALDNALLYQTQRATSRALQQSLLPAALPAVPGLEVGVAYEAAGEGLEAGGDFYDLFGVDDLRWRFAVGDVSGNGPEAAAVTGLARHVLHLLARQDRPLAEAVAQLNQAILTQEGRSRFLTALHGEITLRPAGGIRVVLVVAGHPLPYLVEPAGRVRAVGTHGPLLGVLDQVEYRTETVHLAPGETLVCVTDGVLERRNAGRTLGEDDLGPLLARCAGLSAAATAAALRRAVVEYAPTPPRDDMAVLVLRAVAEAG